MKTRLYLLGLALLAMVSLSACSSDNDDVLTDNTEQTNNSDSGNAAPNDSTNNNSANAQNDSTVSNDSILIVFFSRAGYNYNGSTTNLKWTDLGNTAVMAGYIQERTGAKTFEIVPADPYPNDYMEAVARNMQERNANARPAILNPLNVDMSHYNRVFIGSPVWASGAPMIMRTFYETYRSQLRGKTLIPFGTHEMSGISSLVRTMREELGDNDNTYLTEKGMIGRTITEASSRREVLDWLASIGF